MKRTVLVFGTIAGFLAAAWIIGSVIYSYSVDNYNGSMLVGYAGMLLAFSLVFVGVKNYRDKESGGIISFGKALQVALLISLVASTIYVIAWMITYYNFVPDYLEKYCAQMLQDLKAGGMAGKELAAQTAEMDSMKKMYENPLMVIAFTYMEILPVALLVSLVSAALLKRKAK